jgi:hypothetical protein
MSTSSHATTEFAGRPSVRQAPFAESLQLADWAGASGQRYQHLVYGLIECPLAPKANYVLARRDRAGRTTVLKVGRTSHDAPTLNRAQLRHEAALLGANEIHLHVVARTDAERILVEFDIAATLAHGHPAFSATRH